MRRKEAVRQTCRARTCCGPVSYTLLLTAGLLIWMSAIYGIGALLLP